MNQNENIAYGVLVAIESEQVHVRVNNELVIIPVDAETKAAAESVLGEDNAVVAFDISSKQLLLEADDSESQLTYLQGI
ncbi:hypothetical protein [Lysinibacillus fusiformis]|uniref:hypothetical protein n=1 Tax=Lysinibacillus fusiformis TaxID=28031 RepID=UPI000D3D1B54|nr:hypothetical protein [Lysinibacillus fusiformis]MED4672335.1 hypothetical protein [Lysinibacillus fusiformis]RDV25296.1 hypothetical protein C7B90_22840 [Lysinibacillus fusiformis]GED65626.1 hypothetical protein LFU01_40780 [Lysinibacillus fusiformis]